MTLEVYNKIQTLFSVFRAQGCTELKSSVLQARKDWHECQIDGGDREDGEAQHLGIGLPFSGSFTRAFGKGHRGLLDGCFLCNESAGLITLAWITD